MATPWWRDGCESLPAGHWHCGHGHLRNCPVGADCPRVDFPEVDATTWVVQAGPTVWLFDNKTLALLQRLVLNHGGAAVKTRQLRSARAVERLLRDLPERRTVEDCRTKTYTTFCRAR